MSIERSRKKRLAAGIAVVGAALVAALSIGVAGAATRSDGATAATTTAGGATDGSYVAASSDDAGPNDLIAKVRRTVRRLMSDPAFRQDLAELRTQHRESLDALLEKHGVDVSDARKAAQRARAKVQRLMSDDELRADLWRIRDAREAEMEQWWDSYADDPTTVAARKAFVEIHQKYGAQLRNLLEDNGVDLPDKARNLLRGLSAALLGTDGASSPLGPTGQGSGVSSAAGLSADALVL
jgi:hypothetical protein